MARELKLTQTLTGWFDVKVYNERIPKENWKMKGEDDNITFGVTFAAGDPAAVAFAAHGKPYADSNGNQRLRVTFKIGPRCRWFDANANPVTKPSNIDIDGKPFEVVIQYNEVAGDPTNPKSPRGYWVDAIQFREVLQNPFSAMAGAAPVPPMPQQPQQHLQPRHPQQQRQQTHPQYQQPQPDGNIGFPPPPEDLFAPRGISAPMQPMYNDSDNLPY